MNKSNLAGLLLAMTPAFGSLAAGDNTLQKTLLNHAVTDAGSAAKQRYIILFDQHSLDKQGQSATLTGQKPVFANGRFSSANATELVSRIGGDVIHTLPSVSGMAVQLNPQQVAALKRDGQVSKIEVDPRRHFETESQPYGITKVQADQLSDSNTASIKICIADTGIDLNHQDLVSGNITGEVSNTLTIEADIGEWSTDTYGHGTHMAGTIAAVGGNNLGTVGVNPGGNIKLHVVKIVENPGWWPFYGSDLIAAVERCQVAGADIINMSIAGSQSSEAERVAMQAAYDAGVLLVAASGKGGSAAHSYPASYESVISAAATDSADEPWIYSHFNDQIELSAPGVAVPSITPGNKTASLDGTSVSTAYISGSVGLVWSHHPECSNQQIRGILQQSAKDLGTAGRDDNSGHGLIQAKDAVDLIDLHGCDGNGALNSLPVIAGSPASSVDEGQSYLFLPVVSDADEGDTLTLSISNKPAWATFNPQTGELSGIPANGQAGLYNDISITVTDSNGASASTLLFSIEVVNVDFPPTNAETEQVISLQGSDIVLTNPDGSIMSVVSINDADANPTNELQTMSQSGDTVSLSHGGGSFVLIKGDTGEQGIQGVPGTSSSSLWIDGAGTINTTAEVTINSTLEVTGNIASITPTANDHVVIKGYLDNKNQNLQSQVDILLSRIAQLEANVNALSAQLNPPPEPAQSTDISWQTSSYQEQHKLLDSAGITWDKFGSSISISGRTLVIGADNKDDKGHVFVYYDSDNDGDFTDEVVQSLLPTDIGGGDSFGNHVANTDDTIVVGTRMGHIRRGSMYIYHDSDHDGNYAEEIPQKFVASDSAYGDVYGESVDISGHTIVVGASGTEVNGDRSGSIYIYTDPNKDNDFSDALEQKISPANGGILHHYGFMVAIDNGTIAVGAKGYNDNSGTVYVYHDANNDGVYTDETVQQILNNDHSDIAKFGKSVTLNDNILVIGAPIDRPSNGSYRGSAFVYRDSDLDGNYSEEAGDKFVATDVTGSGSFGSGIAVSSDTLIITASGDSSAIGTGSAYVYRDSNSNGSFSDETPQRLETSAFGFGYEVAYQNNELFFSSFYDNANGDYSGSAYHFSLSNEFASTEGAAFVGVVSATANNAATITYSIVELHDGAKFTIDNSGSLSFISAPDFEAPTDADNNNRYQLRVRATANGEHSDVDLTVTVTDVIE